MIPPAHTDRPSQVRMVVTTTGPGSTEPVTEPRTQGKGYRSTMNRDKGLEGTGGALKRA